MSLLSMCTGIAQEKRWAQLAIEPPKPKKIPEPIPFVELTISPEMQRHIDAMAALNKWVREHPFL